MTTSSSQPAAAAAGTSPRRQARRWVGTAVTGVLVLVTVLGVALIYIGSRQTSTFAREFFIGLGAAVGPAAMVALLFRAFLMADLEREFVTPLTNEVKDMLGQTLPRQVGGLIEGYRREIQDIGMLHEGGLLRSYSNREEAVSAFIGLCMAEVKPPSLVVLGSSLLGILPDEYCPFAEVVRRDPNAAKFVLTHPVVADLRAQQEGRRLQAIGEEIVERLRLLERMGVPAQNVYLYRGTPTCFGIMSPSLKLMLLNPYPYEAVAWDAPCLMVRWEEGRSSYLYENFRVNHFGRIEARSVMTERLEDLGATADELEDRLDEYMQVAELVQRLAPLPQVGTHGPTHLVRATAPGRPVPPGAGGAVDIVVFLDTDEAESIDRVVRAVDALAEALGYQRPREVSTERGSFRRRARAKPRPGVLPDELAGLGDEALKAIRSYFQEKSVDVQRIEASIIVDFVKAVTDVPSALIRLDTLVVVKYTDGNGPTIRTRNLTPDELRAVEIYPDIESRPEAFFEALHTAVAALAVDPEVTDVP